jgi:hypothetical protein
MTTETIIIQSLNSILVALTPLERWEATKRFNTSFLSEHLFLIAAMTGLTLLVALLIWVSYNRVMEERRIAEQLFFEQAQKRGLSGRERQILVDVVGKSRLKQRNAIFTMQDAFDRGAVGLMEERLASQRPPEEADQLRAELSFLREKLGFQPASSVGSPGNPKRLSSRQIPVGKTVHVTRRKARSSTSIECIVLKNTEVELAIRLAMPVQSTPGEYWRVRYYFGASVLEFDTSVVRCDGDILAFNHSENVRFVNRRRFLRVSVKRPAFIAHFPFARISPQTIDRNGKNASKVTRASAIGRAGVSPPTSDGGASPTLRCWGAPEFIPAVVTELAGPGLCVEAPLKAKVGDRVLVIFSLDERENPAESPSKGRKTVPSKIVQDIGLVRHTKATGNGMSIAVELVGLTDSDVDELIRATNAASPRTGDQGKKTLAPDDGKQVAEQELAESATTQGRENAR